MVVAGLSMGGALALWLAAHHPEIAGVVCVNPVVEVGAEMVDGIRQMVDGGVDRIPPSAATWPTRRSARRRTTPRPATAAQPRRRGRRLARRPGQDHLPGAADQPPGPRGRPHNSDIVAERVSGPVERITLERSYHVATLDYDKDLIFERAVEFADRVTGPG